MKTIRLLQVAMLSAIVAFTSCNKDELSGSSSGKEVTVTLATQLPSPTAKTRAASEEIAEIPGFHLRYVLEVWTKETAPKLYKREVIAANGQNQAQFNVSLLNGREFDILLWADYARDGYDDDLHYNTGSDAGLKAITRSNPTTNTPYVNEQNDHTLAPTRDAFFAHATVTASADVVQNITLKRAVSQLNIYTTDLADVSEGFKPANTKVTISSASSFNVLGESSFGSAYWTSTLAVNPTATDNKNKVFTGYYFTSAKGKNIVNFDTKFFDASGVAITTYSMSNIPIQQNYRTNITGALLTKKGTINVETEAAYDGDHNDDGAPITPPTEDGIWYSTDGGEWVKWENTTMPNPPSDGNYTYFSIRTLGQNNPITVNHLKAITDYFKTKTDIRYTLDMREADYENTSFPNTFSYSNDKQLASILLPRNIITTIYEAFKACKLDYIYLPDGFTTITDNTFGGGINTIRIPSSLEVIGRFGLAQNNFETIDLPSGLKTIDYAAFNGCKNLRAIIIPNQVKEINGATFMECYNLKTVYIPDGIKTIPGNLFMKDYALEEVRLPATIEGIIGGYAFTRCYKLRSIHLPEKVTKIDQFAFSGCLELSIFRCDAMTAPAFEQVDGIFGVDATQLTGLNVKTEKTLIVPKGATGYEELTTPDGGKNYWKTELIDKCGYTIKYVDFENAQGSISAGQKDWQDGGTININKK